MSDNLLPAHFSHQMLLMLRTHEQWGQRTLKWHFRCLQVFHEIMKSIRKNFFIT